MGKSSGAVTINKRGRLQRHPSLPTEGRRRRRGQPRCEAALQAAQATALARGLGPVGKRTRQAPQDGRIFKLHPRHVQHNLAERSVMGSSPKAVASENADALPRKTRCRARECCS